MKFSQRYGHTLVKNAVQLGSMDQELRNSLWSALKLRYWDTMQPDIFQQHKLSNYGNEHLRMLCTELWIYFFKRPLDNLSDNWEGVYGDLRTYFFACKWYEVYDFVEFVAQSDTEDSRKTQFQQRINLFLEREVSAYRFVAGPITQITGQEEVDAIEEATATKTGPVSDHLNRALQLLSDRRSPDYRNSIKESISAVEAQVKFTMGVEKGTLGDLLRQLTRKSPLHPALETAFEKLYGYTSDAEGIRHALLSEDRVTFEEAKFMLVACSAFINYVRSVLKT